MHIFALAMCRVASLLAALASSAAAFHPRHRAAPTGLLRLARAHGPVRGRRRSSALPAGPAFCEACGAPMITAVPEGDERERRVCADTDCGFVAYQNPKVVVGAICTRGDRVLLCQRAIEPCKGKWGYPQGFLELGETTRQGAARETQEEAGAVFDPKAAELLAVYNLAGAQVQVLYRVELESDDFAPGQESSDVVLCTWDEIPWEDLAFPTVKWALEYAREVRDEARPAVQERTKRVTGDGTWTVEEG